MKTLKFLTATLLALSSFNVGFSTTLKITGSTTVRTALHGAIVQALGGYTAGNVRVISCDPESANRTPDQAQQAVYINSSGDIVQVCLTGSVGGIGYIVSGDSVSPTANPLNANRAWLKATTFADAVAAGWPTVTSGGSAFGYSGGTITTNGIKGNLGMTSSLTTDKFEAPSTASICFSDCRQDSTQYDSVDWGITLHDELKGTVGYVFCKGAIHPAGNMANAWNHLTNISAQNFLALINKGCVDLSFITGNTTPLASGGDLGVDVVLVGLNSNSGTRFAVFAETGVGPSTSGAKQYTPVDVSGIDAVSGNSTSGSVNGFALTPDLESGYDSDAYVKLALTRSISSSSSVGPKGHPFILVAYTSLSEIGGTPLTYNGVTCTQSNILHGAYTLWTTEHLLYDTGVIPYGGPVHNLLQNISQTFNILNSSAAYIAPASYTYPGMLCSRVGVEGSTVVPND